MRVVIIEDEDLTAEDLCQTLIRLDPDIEIIQRLSSVEQSIRYLKTSPLVDLIFSDVQLGDGDSFDVFRKVDPGAPIVFCTAYDHYTMEAFRTYSIDYILKPFSDADIQEALAKFRRMRSTFNKNLFLHLPNLKDPKPEDISEKPKNLIVSSNGMIVPLKIKDIALCYIEFENVFAKTFQNKDYLVGKSLDEMEEVFGKDFFRANRQHLVNRNAIDHAVHGQSRNLVVKLLIDHVYPVSVSREKLSLFLDWLQG